MKQERYGEQLRATRAAIHLIPLLPLNCSWGLSVTDEDGPYVLSIFVTQSGWQALVAAMKLPEKPNDKGYGFVTYKYKALLVSFIDEEVEDERDERSSAAD